MTSTGATKSDAPSMGPARNLFGDIMDALKGKPEFLPIADINAFTSEARIKEVLQDPDLQLQPEDIHHHLNYILQRPAKKVFLILVRCEKSHLIADLSSTDFSDDDLPIIERYDRDLKKMMADSAREPPKCIEFFKKNDAAPVFVFKQWSFMAPMFQSSRFEYELKPEIPLPLIEEGKSQQSGFSSVRKVKVHPSHIEGKTGYLALKQLKDMDDQQKYLDKERKNLVALRGLDHPHLIKPAVICIQGEKVASFFFPWADGGNLRDFWKKDPTDYAATSGWMLEQMTGLCGALASLAAKNCRHSDLKPENILHFFDNTKRGTLKITDVGLSKFHILVTSRRPDGTTAKHTTERYCPPEFDPQHSERRRQLVEGTGDGKLSRRFDIWSLGCVFVEFLIWAVLGQKRLKEYETEMGPLRRFWEFKNGSKDGSKGGNKSYHLSPEAKDWIEKLKEKINHPVLNEVLKLIEKEMLLTNWDRRLTASEVHARMNAILGEQSLVTPLEVQRVSGPSDETAGVPDTAAVGQLTSGSVLTSMPPLDTAEAQNYNTRQNAKLRDHWTVRTDNEFAQSFFSRVGRATPRERSQLCDVCSTFRIWEPQFTISEVVGNFAARSSQCDLCKLLHTVSKGLGLGEREQLHCVRRASTMNMTEPDNRPILSLFADPDGKSPQLEFAQVGYPTLPLPDSPRQYQLIRQWLQLCDSEHGHGPETYLGDGTLQMPTRLIYVGDSQIHLEVAQASSFVRYLALSHCWGNGPTLRTLKSNFEALRKEIPINLLPLNFQDAVKVARGLGASYLWIDSLCIIQDDPEDWEREAGRMGLVFSNAYCTIMATSAASSNEGFLARQASPPLSATFKTADEGTLQISEFMEDYHQDVELARLNTRGWVLQERALSRRTLHFTKTQVYWECGKGVHCERLFKLNNPKATLFGDSNFPKSILKYYKGGRITLFQDLYQRYSRLALTRISDRSVAILGLEQRLLEVFKTRGESGIIHEYLQRSLLWCRPDDTFLARIPYPKSRKTPSWSWMAYEGPITYMHVPFDGVDWTDEYASPFETKNSDTTSGSTLKAFARELTLDRVDLLHRVKLDEQHQIPITNLRGVVIGKDKRRQSRDEITHYVLLVARVEGKSGGKKEFVRAGVAWLLEQNVGSNGEYVEIS